MRDNIRKKMIIGLVLLNIVAFSSAHYYFNNSSDEEVVKVNKFNIFDSNPNVTDENGFKVVNWSIALLKYFRK